jgi:uncharacterized protein (UPF0218 family)
MDCVAMAYKQWKPSLYEKGMMPVGDQPSRQQTKLTLIPVDGEFDLAHLRAVRVPAEGYVYDGSKNR